MENGHRPNTLTLHHKPLPSPGRYRVRPLPEGEVGKNKTRSGSMRSCCRAIWIVLALQVTAPAAVPAPPEGESYFFIPPGFSKPGKAARAFGNVKVRIEVRDKASGKL